VARTRVAWVEGAVAFARTTLPFVRGDLDTVARAAEFFAAAAARGLEGFARRAATDASGFETVEREGVSVAWSAARTMKRFGAEPM
jgi:hypothetical protein